MATGLVQLQTQRRCLKMSTLLLMFDQIWCLINPVGEKNEKRSTVGVLAYV